MTASARPPRRGRFIDMCGEELSILRPQLRRPYSFRPSRRDRPALSVTWCPESEVCFILRRLPERTSDSKGHQKSWILVWFGSEIPLKNSQRLMKGISEPPHWLPKAGRRYFTVRLLISDSESISRVVDRPSYWLQSTVIARRRQWLDDVVSGRVTTVAEPCAREKCSGQVNLTISLAILAPNQVKAAMEGRPPRGIGVERSASQIQGRKLSSRPSAHHPRCHRPL
jgi:hypothetical protein